MKKRGRSGNNKKTAKRIFVIVLLALLCIGSAELVACRHFAPELYMRITAPVRRGLEAAEAAYGRLAASAAELWDDYTQRVELAYNAYLERLDPPQEDEAVENQLVSEPVLSLALSNSDGLVTELRQSAGNSILTGGVFETVYYNQGDPEWADKPFGSDNVGGYGCGPTAMAIVVASMTDAETDPALMSQWAAENGYWARGSGSYHSIVEGTAEAFGLQAQALADRTPDGLREALISGNMLVALMGPGHFTNGGHFIVLRGATLSGDILVADPNSEERSLTLWDPQIILDELSLSNDSGGPIWVISKLDS